jgi:hypothetical protein
MASRDRTTVIIEVLRDAFAPLMRADPVAFRAKYRKMARDPLAFYRGAACLFYCDVTGEEDAWADHGAERIWIHGDLHVENFGTYLNSDGRLIFDDTTCRDVCDEPRCSAYSSCCRNQLDRLGHRFRHYSRCLPAAWNLGGQPRRTMGPCTTWNRPC